MSYRDVAFRPKAALGPLIGSLAGLLHSVVTRNVFRSSNIVDRQQFEVEV